SVKANVEWKKLEDADYTKRYFRILERITEEDRQMNFIENNIYVNNPTQTTEKKIKWKYFIPNKNQRVHPYKSVKPVNKTRDIDNINESTTQTELTAQSRFYYK